MKQLDGTKALMRIDSDRPRWSRRTVLFIALFLTVAAALPRFAAVGALSFYGDEETSAFPARSLVERGVLEMPSGMEYRRAIPHTWLNSLSARLFGVDREASYRLPAALLGTLTVLLLFLAGRRFLGDPVALLAAILMAFSSWHLTFSRMNRMYAPLLLFALLATFAAWHWLESGSARSLVLAIVSFAAAVAFHALALAAVVFLVAPIAFPGATRPRTWQPLAFAGVGAGAGVAYWQLFVSVPYQEWQQAPGVLAATERLAGQVDPGFLAVAPWWLWALGMIGVSVGIWGALAAVPVDSYAGAHVRNALRIGLAGLGGATALTGHIYAAILSVLLFLLVYDGERRELVSRAARPIAIMGTSGLTWTLVSVARLGVEEAGKRLAGFPFPYPYFLGKQLWGVMILFAVACVWFSLRSPRDRERGARASVLGAVAVMAALGMVSRWAPNRYLFVIYPFILIAGAYGLLTVIELASRLLVGRAMGLSSKPVVLGIGLVSCGILGSHGIPQAVALVTQDHGRPHGLLSHTLVLRPDHRAAGGFLRGVLEPGDLVIAEDPLQQRWYAGQADYWYRSFRDAGRFVHVDPSGTLRDNYVNSELLADANRLESLLRIHPSGRVWFVNSAETQRDRAYYLSSEQRAWLQKLEATTLPDFVANDSLTRVFCLNCRNDRRDGRQLGDRPGDGLQMTEARAAQPGP